MGLYAAAAVLVLAAAAVAVHLTQTERDKPSRKAPAQIAADWDRRMPDLGAVDRAAGFYPPRRGRICRVPSACSTGAVPSLNALVFENGSPQGVADQRRFLVAQKITFDHETIDRLLDPLNVTPGDSVRISGLVDNSARSATAEDVRALIALPPGSGKEHVVLSSVSAINASPTTVSDSVTLRSDVPVYLRLEKCCGYITRRNEPVSHLPTSLLAMYDPGALDRRDLAGRGARLGCRKRDGRVAAGRSCAFHYQAILSVRYAATADDINGIGPMESAAAEVTAKVRGKDEIFLSWAPKPDTESYLSVVGGTELTLDCELHAHGVNWYHVSDADQEDDEAKGFDTAFLDGQSLTRVAKPLPVCDS